MLKVLLADDDDTLRMVMRDLFESRSWEVVEARDGLEALKILKTEAFSLIVTDMIMPNMDGHHFVSRCRGLVGSVPIVCLSGTSLHLEAIKLAEIDAVFEKPIDVNEFMDGVEKIVAAKKKY